MRAPELLLPAGGLERMHAAYDYGTDAVYAGSPRYSLHARNDKFTKLDIFEQDIKEAHECNKKSFLTVSTLPHNSKLRTFVSGMKPLIVMKPDVLIMADPGLIMTVHEKWSEMSIHLSVQVSITNYWGMKFWQNIGVERIILPHELSMGEIAKIHQECSGIELEVFIRDALCIAYSSRYLLSGYFNHRDPSQGTCINSCCWDYKVHNAVESDAGDTQPLQGFNFEKAQGEANQNFEGINGQKRHPYADKVLLIEESSRPGKMMPIMGDERDTYIMNSKGLRGIEVVEKLAGIGVDNLKAGGHTESLYYVTRVAQSYRKTIDNAVTDRPFDYNLLGGLEGLANRGYTSDFLGHHQTQDYQNYLTGHSIAEQSQYVGHVTEIDENDWATIEVKSRFAVGDSLEIIHPSGNQTIESEQMTREGQPVDIASGSGIQVKIPNMQGKEEALVARIMNP